jgi:WS/DGAT/MGAT family acyltransferase
MRWRVAGRDAIWLQDTASNLMVINAVFITDRVGVEQVRDAFQRRLLDAGGGHAYARFRHRVVWVDGQAWWEEDPQFDLARQIIAAPEPIHTTESLRRFVAREAARPLPEDRPRWQFQIAPDFEGDATAIVGRLHHSIGDGVSLVAALFALMDEEIPTTTAERRALRPAGGVPRKSWATALAIPLAAPGVLIRRMLWPADRHALHGPTLAGEKQVAWTAPMDIEVIKYAKNRLGATVNDVLMACVSGALSRFLVRQGGELVREFHVSMPVNIRPQNAPLKLENRFAAVPLQLPAGIAGLAERVGAVKARMDALKRSVEPIVVYGIQGALLRMLPQGMSRGLIDFLANKCTAVVTNVPGPQGIVRLAGSRVRSMVFWVPQRARIGLGISVLSFAGKVQVGIIADRRVVPDIDELVRDFEAEFEALRRMPR